MRRHFGTSTTYKLLPIVKIMATSVNPSLFSQVREALLGSSYIKNLNPPVTSPATSPCYHNNVPWWNLYIAGGSKKLNLWTVVDIIRNLCKHFSDALTALHTANQIVFWCFRVFERSSEFPHTDHRTGWDRWVRPRTSATTSPDPPECGSWPRLLLSRWSRTYAPCHRFCRAAPPHRWSARSGCGCLFLRVTQAGCRFSRLGKSAPQILTFSPVHQQ